MSIRGDADEVHDDLTGEKANKPNAPYRYANRKTQNLNLNPKHIVLSCFVLSCLVLSCLRLSLSIENKCPYNTQETKEQDKNERQHKQKEGTTTTTERDKDKERQRERRRNMTERQRQRQRHGRDEK